MSVLFGIGLSILSSVFKSGKSITTKIAAGKTDSYITSLGTRIVGIALFGVLLLLYESLYIPSGSTVWISLIGSSSILALITILFSYGLEISDISVITPLMSLIPVTTLIPAIFILGEIPSPIAGIGLVLITVGTYTLQIHELGNGILKPFKATFTDRGAQYVLFGVLISGLIPTFDKIGITETSALFWGFSTHIVTTIMLLIVTLYMSDNVNETIKSEWKVLFVLGCTNAILVLLQNYAYTFTQVTYVQAVKRVSILFSMVGGYVLFDEPYIRQRLVSAVLIILGVGAIIMGA